VITRALSRAISGVICLDPAGLKTVLSSSTLEHSEPFDHHPLMARIDCIKTCL
jgi:hypothetical protein